ncbi:DegT/DnrJ/EryC1/StrS family aminotransferase [Candidatus Pacearchaeota archaeon]|nr:DegT/DnrJ/EryC1/StrS family aminotransferase [Candidatus Pacearchaeota archaeon]
MKIKLMHDPISADEIIAINKCLESGQYTQGTIVDEFEKEFAKWNGSRYAVMVNSGSSANLIMVSLLKDKFELKETDEVLVPSVTWPTTVYPLIQNNLSPVFCDVDETFNISFESIKKMYSPCTKAIFLVHLLGQPVNLKEIINFCEEKNIIVMEDCCEALGANIEGKKVGRFGLMGSFSFYFGHHMATIEGGMVVTDDFELYDLLKSIRSHGWVRNSIRSKEYEKDYASLDFVFDNLGYNLRSTNINATIGLEQLKKVDKSIEIRNRNHKLFDELISKNPFVRLQKVRYKEMSSFCLPLILPSIKERDILLKELPNAGIECRTVIAGNLLSQPIFSKKLKGKYRADECVNSDIIHNCGFYLPNHQFIKEENVVFMIDKINEILKYEQRSKNFGNGS